MDDKVSAQRLIADYLSANGFRTVTANNGREALYVARHEKPDLVLLDIMMPEMDGYEFLRHFRKERNTPVIMLTAKMEETDKVVGLELGADDYVTKPFGMAELVARVRAVLRRVYEEPSSADVLQPDQQFTFSMTIQNAGTVDVSNLLVTFGTVQTSSSSSSSSTSSTASSTATANTTTTTNQP